MDHFRWRLQHHPATDIRNFWFAGRGATYEVSPEILGGAEIFRTTAGTVNGTNGTSFNVDAMYNISDKHHLLFSVGCNIANTASNNLIPLSFICGRPSHHRLIWIRFCSGDRGLPQASPPSGPHYSRPIRSLGVRSVTRIRPRHRAEMICGRGCTFRSNHEICARLNVNEKKSPNNQASRGCEPVHCHRRVMSSERHKRRYPSQASNGKGILNQEYRHA